MHETMTAKADGRFVPRKVRRRQRMRRCQNLTLGMVFFTVAFGYISTNIYYMISGNNVDSDHFYETLRGASEERSIWVSQNSQPFVSFVDRVLREPLEK